MESRIRFPNLKIRKRIIKIRKEGIITLWQRSSLSRKNKWFTISIICKRLKSNLIREILKLIEITFEGWERSFGNKCKIKFISITVNKWWKIKKIRIRIIVIKIIEWIVRFIKIIGCHWFNKLYFQKLGC